MQDMNIKKKTEGMTLVTLSVIIIILIILTGIVLYSGRKTIQKTKLEEMKTNMLQIQAKARKYIEDASVKMGIHNTDEEKKQSVRNEVYVTNAQLEKAVYSDIPSDFEIPETDQDTCYWLTPEAEENWGLSEMELGDDDKYLIRFDEVNITVEVYNTQGYDGKYSLTEIDAIQK